MSYADINDREEDIRHARIRHRSQRLDRLRHRRRPARQRARGHRPCPLRRLRRPGWPEGRHRVARRPRRPGQPAARRHRRGRRRPPGQQARLEQPAPRPPAPSGPPCRPSPRRWSTPTSRSWWPPASPLLAEGRACQETDRSPARRPGVDARRQREPRAGLRRSRRAERSSPGSRRPCTASATTVSSPSSRRPPASTAVSGYVGDGSAAWAAVHVSDAARLIRLEPGQGAGGHDPARDRRGGRADPGDRRGHRRQPRPPGDVDHRREGDRALRQFVGRFFGIDFRATNAATRELLDWTPAGPTLIEDIKAGGYPGIE